MLVARYTHPYRDIRRSFDLMNTLLNAMEPAQEEGAMSDFVPAVNTRESDDAYYIELDLPGIRKEDIEITTEDNVLTISGERKHQEEVNEEDYYRIESVYGKFTRSFTLPDKVDAEKIKAHSQDGVLEVVIPKLEEKVQKTRKITIK
jgi:HSP20 family protein